MEVQQFGSNMSSKRSKRGRHAAISSLLVTKSDEHELGCLGESDVELAANSLMMFARDGSLLSNRPDMAALEIEEPINSFKLDRRKKRVRTKKVLDAHFDSCVDQEMKYKCKTCTRKFSSFQALGGHRASCCNKFKPSCDDSSNMCEEIEGLTEETSDYEDDLQSFNKLPSGNEGWGNRAKPGHECPICYRVFSSGQALGGHKRCHSTPPAPPSTSPAAAAPVGLDNSPCLSTIEEHRPVKYHGLLDLNMPPPLEEEDCRIDNDVSVLSRG